MNQEIIKELFLDQFGNYVVQKAILVSNQDNQLILLKVFFIFYF